MFSLSRAGVLLLSQLPGGQRRALTCTRISRQSSRTFCRSRSSTSDICSGNAPPLCPCRGCSLCHSTSGRSCHSHWKSCCIVWKKENAVSECRFLRGFSQTVWVDPAQRAPSQQLPTPARVAGEALGCPHTTCHGTQNNIKLLF